MLHQGKIPGAAPAILALVSPAEKRALPILSWETTSVTLLFFNQLSISSYILVKQTRVGLREDPGCNDRR